MRACAGVGLAHARPGAHTRPCVQYHIWRVARVDSDGLCWEIFVRVTCVCVHAWPHVRMHACSTSWREGWVSGALAYLGAALRLQLWGQVVRAPPPHQLHPATRPPAATPSSTAPQRRRHHPNPSDRGCWPVHDAHWVSMTSRLWPLLVSAPGGMPHVRWRSRNVKLRAFSVLSART